MWIVFNLKKVGFRNGCLPIIKFSFLPGDSWDSVSTALDKIEGEGALEGAAAACVSFPSVIEAEVDEVGCFLWYA